MPSTLFDQTAQWFARAHAALLGQLPCGPGCSACCVGLFPVTILDRQEVQRGLGNLPDEQRRRIERTASEQIAFLTAVAPRLNGVHFIDQWPDEEIDRLIEKFDTWPCPALEHDGQCGLYEYRPLVCRSMGIPEEHDGVVSGACTVQMSIPLIRLPKAIREEEHLLAEREAKELSVVRRRDGVSGEELFSPFAFLPDVVAKRTTDPT